ncbi:helix-turn-helix domain-containing protein [Candidatus Enterococcus clewellii]|uniref:Helix-turn-helix domain-containing protein n=1 Tax=Candidatus Enterococcus clewellii TaxID=1834193 RepID=A0A242K8C4_9ENTE|nr:helix-turn-helix domain-containing protein [Enterococcus sp. 9E7_DIV0242]OTP17425.1 hypothetical protein A5888_001563 [Enterococcus sp. 9E7_DIV0242]
MNETDNMPLLLNREQASKFLGVDPATFDKYIRNNDDLKRFMVGKRERYLKSELIKFIETHLVS